MSTTPTLTPLEQLDAESRRSDQERLRELRTQAKPILDEIQDVDRQIKKHMPAWMNRLNQLRARYQIALNHGVSDLNVLTQLGRVGGGVASQGLLVTMPNQLKHVREQIEEATLEDFARPRCLDEWRAEVANVKNCIRAVNDSLNYLDSLLRDGGDLYEAVQRAIAAKQTGKKEV